MKNECKNSKREHSYNRTPLLYWLSDRSQERSWSEQILNSDFILREKDRDGDRNREGSRQAEEERGRERETEKIIVSVILHSSFKVQVLACRNGFCTQYNRNF